MSKAKVSERDARVEKLTQAIIFAQLSQDPPVIFPAEAVRAWAEVLDDCGVRQTDELAETVPTLPNWMTHELKQSTPEQDRPVPQPMAGKARVAQAPKIPKHIKPSI
jgi:hypothetical protein